LLGGGAGATKILYDNMAIRPLGKASLIALTLHITSALGWCTNTKCTPALTANIALDCNLNTLLLALNKHSIKTRGKL